MAAHSQYITSILNTLATYLEIQDVPQEDREATTLLLLQYLENKKNVSSWNLDEFNKFLENDHGAAKFDTNPKQLVRQFVNDFPPYQTNVLLHQYLLALKETGCSHSTIKNYRSDINQFLQFSNETVIKTAIQKPKVADFLRYQRQKGLKRSTVRQKLVSITQFAQWLKNTGTFNEPLSWLDTLADHLEDIDTWELEKVSNPTPKRKPRIADTKKRAWSLPITGSKPPASKKTAADTAQDHQEFRERLKNHLSALSNRVDKGTKNRLLPYLNFAMLILFVLGAGVFGYRQFIRDADSPLAYPSALTAPNRTLSFQGRLTDSAKNPVTSSTNVRFKLYDSGPGTGSGNILWNSGTCAVDPDQDGIFSVGLGDDCGSEITEDVFTENTNVWLQVEIDNGSSYEVLEPRQSIKTVPYALNAETLQGYPASPSAVESTVVVMDENGNINLGSENPELRASSGTFTIEAQSLTLQTASGSNGDIVLAPDGTGEVSVLSDLGVFGDLTSTGYISAPGATLSATYAEGTALVTRGGPGGTANIQEWQDSSGTALSVVDESGMFGINSDNPGSVLEVSNPNAEPSIFQVVNSVGHAGISVINASARVGIGNVTSPNYTLEVGGETYINGALTSSKWIDSAHSQYYIDAANSALRLSPAIRVYNGSTDIMHITTGHSYINTGGSLGIGTTAPSYKLDVSGDINLTGALRASGDAGTAGYLLTSSAGGAMTWTDPSSVASTFSLWQIYGRAISPKVSTDDLLIGGNASASALVRLPGTSGEDAWFNTGGNVGIGTTAPTEMLHINNSGSNAKMRFTSENIVLPDNAPVGTIEFETHDLANPGVNAYIRATAYGTNGNLGLAFGTGGTASDKMYLDPVGRLGIGTTRPSGELNIATTGSGNFYFDQYIVSTGSSNSFSFRKSRNSNLGTLSTTVSQDLLGKISWAGVNGNNTWASGAQILSRQSGSSTADYVPAYLAFSTTDTTNGLTERVRITPEGRVGIGTEIPITQLSLGGTGATNGITLGSDQGADVNIYHSTSPVDGVLTMDASRVQINAGYITLAATYTNLGTYITNTPIFINNAGIGIRNQDQNDQMYIRNALGSENAIRFLQSNNSTEVFRAQETGEVGIGITNPAYKLDVSGDINLTGALRAGGDAGTSGYLLTSGGGSAMTWTDPSSVASTFSLWQINGRAISPKVSTDDLLVGHSATASALVRLPGTSGEDAWFNTGGNVGIGTTAPNSNLEIAQSSQSTGEGLTWSLLGDDWEAYMGGGNAIEWRYNGARYFSMSTGGSLYLGGGSPTGTGDLHLADRLIDWDNSNYYLDLDNSVTSALFAGKVGIGTTSPSEKLTVVSDDNTSTTNIANFLANNLTLGIGIGYNEIRMTGTTTNTPMYINAKGSGTLNLQNNATGSVIIGANTSDGYKLEISGNQGIQIEDPTYSRISLKTTNNNFFLQTEDQTGDWFGIYDGTNNQWRLNVLTDGNVGIGTTAPAYKLDVAGDINLTGALRVGGDAGTSGYLLTSSAGGVNTWTDPDTITSAGWWDNTDNILHPKDEYAGVVDLALGGNSTASANVRLSSSGDGYFGGNVGIGTTSPGEKLDIVGKARFLSGSTSTYETLQLGRSASELTIAVAANTNDFATGTLAGDSIIRTVAGQDLFLGSSGIKVDGGNNGWINMPTNSWSGIGSGGSGVNAWIGYSASNGQWFTNAIAGDINYRNTTGALNFGNSATTIAMRVVNNNVGIGTTNPTEKLTIDGNIFFPFIAGTDRTISTGDNPASGHGNDLILEGGIGGTGSYLGGAVKLFGGNGNTGGEVEIAGGAGTSATGGAVNISGGTGNVTGGTVTIKGGVSGGGSGYVGGDLILEGGLPGNSGSRGDITLGYKAADGQNIRDGNISIYGTNSNWWGANPGDVTIEAGSAENYSGSTFAGGSLVLGSGSGTNSTNYGIIDIKQGSDSRIYIDGSGNTGIGTTTPAYKLDVSGDINLTGALRAGGDAGTSGYLLTSSGGGVNTWSDPAALVNANSYWQLNGRALSSKISTDDVLVGGNATASALIRLPGTSGEDAWFNTGGNVGIGTTSPIANLDVIGTGTNTTIRTQLDSTATDLPTAHNALFLSNNDQTDNNWVKFSFGGSPSIPTQSAASIGLQFTDHSSNYGSLAFWTRGTAGWSEKMRIEDNGNVGIGTTAPSYKLDVNGSANIASDLYFTKEIDHTIQLLDSTTVDTAGANLTLISAAGKGISEGGDISLFAGQGGDGTGNPKGGDVFIAAGNAGASWSQYHGQGGGAVTISGGNARINGNISNSGGPVNLLGGEASSNDAGGAINITGGAHTSGAGPLGGGGTVNIAGGTSKPSSSNGYGGTINIFGGTGNLAGDGGDLNLTGGTPGVTGDGGDIGIISGPGGSTSGNSGNLTLGTGSVTSGTIGTIAFKQGSNNRLFINSSGLVGIGTTSPAYKLEVSDGNDGSGGTISAKDGGAILMTGDGGYPLQIGNNTGGANSVRFRVNMNGSMEWGPSTSTNPTINIAGGKYLELASGSGLRVTSGEVGIGTTAPAYKLDVAGDINLTGALRAGGDAGTSGYLLTSSGGGVNTWSDPAALVNANSYWQLNDRALSSKISTDDVLVGGNATASALIRLPGTSGEDAWFNTGGNVGIGTTAPSNQLHIVVADSGATTQGHLSIENNSDTRLGIYSGNGNVGKILFGDDGSASVGQIDYYHSTDSLAFWTNNQRQLTLDSAGRLGIGTTAPAYKLSIGSADATDQFGLYHDNANAYLTTTDGSFIFQTDEGTDTDSVVDIRGKGTGEGILRLYDTDTGSFGEIWNVNGKTRIESRSGSTNSIALQPRADGNITMFEDALSGENPWAQIAGWDSVTGARKTGKFSIDTTGDFNIEAESGEDISLITNGQDRVRIANSGYVGIGTTDPEAIFHIYEGANNEHFKISTSTIANFYSIYSQTGDAIIESASNNSTVFRSGANASDEGFFFQIDPGFGGSPTDVLSILNNGRVGIGTTAPTYKLDVTGDINLTGALRAGGDAGTAGYLLTSGAGGAMTWTDPSSVASTFSLWQINGRAISPKVSTDDLLVGGNATASALVRLPGTSGEDAWFNTGGNVGIGTTAPGVKLEVRSESDNSTALKVSSSTGTDLLKLAQGSTGFGILSVHDNIGNMQVKFNSGSNSFINGGNLGIGTTSPSTGLHISKDSQQLLVEPSSSTGQDGIAEIRGHRNAATTVDNAQLIFSNYDDDITSTSKMGMIAGKVTDSTNNYGDLVFYNYSNGSTASETMRLTKDGFVGIGTTAPAYKLDVAGDINLTGALRAGGDAGTSGYLLTSSAGGVNTWTDPAALVNANSYWQLNGRALSSKISTDDVLVGGNATASALIRLPGTSGENAWFNTGGNVGIGTTSPNAKLHVVGNITSPGGISSEKFGYNSVASGQESIAFGHSSSATSTSSIAIGYASEANGSTSGIAIGRNAKANSSQTIAIGTNITVDEAQAIGIGSDSSATGTNAIAIGVSSQATGGYSTALGRGAQAINSEATALGRSAIASGTYTTAIGTFSSASFSKSVAIGSRATTTASNQFVSGSDSHPLTSVYFGKGVSDDSPLNYTIHGTSGEGTDINGANLQLAGGQGTGTGAGGSILFQTASSGSSGTILNSLQNRMIITDDGFVGIGTTNPGQELDVTGDARVSGQFISTVSTGTAPISVASTTLVSNLNADLLDGYEATEFCQADGSNCTIGAAAGWTDDGTIVRLTTGTDDVGIGTTNPGGKLEIAGDTTMETSLIVKANTSDNGNIQEWQNSSGTILSNIEADGDLNMRDSGIIFNSSDARIEQNTPIRMQLTANTDATHSVGFRAVSNSSTLGSVQYGSSIYSTKSVADANSYNGLQLTTTISASSGTQNLARGMLNVVRLTGAATLDDAYALHGRVDNNSTGTIGTARAAFIDANINSGGGTITNNYGLYINNQNVGSTSNYSIFTNLGDVSLGDNLILRNDSDRLQLGAAQDLELYHDGANSYISNNAGDLYIGDTGTDDVILSANGGRVGIGVTSPAYELDVLGRTRITNDTAAPALNLYQSAAAGSNYMIDVNLAARGSSILRLYGYDNDTVDSVPIFIGDENGYTDLSMTLPGDGGGSGPNWYLRGRVGIGNTDPTYKLDVAGDINLTGALRAGGDAGTSGYLLTSSGGGAMTWTDPSTLGGDTSWWDNTDNLLHPKDEYAGVVDLALGGNSTASANVRLSSNGDAYFAGDVGINDSTPSYALDVDGKGRFTETLGVGVAPLDHFGLNVQQSYTDATNDSRGISGDIRISASTTNSKWYVANMGMSRILDTTSANLTGTTIGVWGNAQVQAESAITVDNTIGVNANSFLTSDAQATITNMKGINVSIGNQSTAGGTITNAYGAMINTPISTGTISNVTGLYIGSQNVGSSSNYSIYTNLGDISLGDNLILRNDSDRLQLGAAQDLELYHDGSNSYISNSTGDLYIGDTGTDDVILSANGGNVGIGTTAPSYKLEVADGNDGGGGIISAKDGGAIFMASNGNYPLQVGNNTTGIDSVRFRINVNGLIEAGGGYDSETSPTYSFMNDPDTGMFQAATDEIGFTLGGSELVRIDSAGKIGLGVSNPTANIHLLDNSADTSIKLEQSTNVGANMWWDQGVGVYYIDNMWDNAGADIRFRTRTAGTPVELLTLAGDGNIGVGDTSPSYKLDVAGTGRFTSTLTLDSVATVSDNNFVLTRNTSTNAIEKIDTTNWDKDNSDEIGGAGTGTTNYLAKWSDDSTLTNSVVYDDGTNVGIGTTSPGSKLSISNDGDSPTGNALLSLTQYDDEDLISATWDNSGSPVTTFRVDNGGDIFARKLTSYQAPSYFLYPNAVPSQISMTLGGRAGIGTNSPNEESKLHVASSSAMVTPTTITIEDTYSTFGWADNTIFSQLNFDSGDTSGIGAGTRAKIAAVFEPDGGFGTVTGLGFYTSNTTDGLEERFRINNDGNVGIGTTAPEQVFHVVGETNGKHNLLFEFFNDDPGLKPTFWSKRSRGTAASPTTLVDGDNLYLNEVSGFDGTNYRTAGRMGFDVDGTVGTNIMPGRFFVALTTDTGGSPQERFTIRQDGNVGIGVTAPTDILHVESTNVNVRLQSTSDSGYIRHFYQSGTTAEAGYRWNVGLRGDTNNRFAFEADTTGSGSWKQHLVIEPEGNVGIGTTAPLSDSNVNIHNGTSGQDSVLTLSNVINTSSSSINLIEGQDAWGSVGYSYGFQLSYSGTGNRFEINRANGGASVNALSISRATGYVGIGTTAPLAGLEIDAAGFVVKGSLPSKSYSSFDYGLGLESTTGLSTINAIDNALAFNVGSNAGTEAMRIATSGRVGIGTTDPSQQFEISGTAPTMHFEDTTASAYSYFLHNNSNNFYVLVDDDGDNAWDSPHPLYFSGRTANFGGSINAISNIVSSTGAVTISDSAQVTGNLNTNGYIYDSGGELTLQDTTNVIGALNVENSGSAMQALFFQNSAGAKYIRVSDSTNYCTMYSTIGVGCSSDIRLKKDIENIANPLDQIMALRAVEYHFNSQSSDEKLNLGFIAQEVEPIIPEVVQTDENGYKSITYSNFVPLLAGAIQEQQLQINEIADSNLAASDLLFDESGNLIIEKSGSNYLVRNTADNSILTKVGGLAELVAGKIRAGSISVRELSADSIRIGGLSLQDYIASTVLQLSGDETATQSGELVSPVAELDSLEVSGESKLAALLVGENATISGTLNAATVSAENIESTGATKLGELTANTASIAALQAETASVAGSLTADTIEAATISAHSTRLALLESRIAEFEHVKATTAEFMDATVSGTLYADSVIFRNKIAAAKDKPSILEVTKEKLSEPEESTNSAETEMQPLYDTIASSGYEASSSADLDLTLADLDLTTDDVTLTAEATFINNYFRVNGTAYIADSLGIGNQLLIGQGTRIADGSIGYTAPAGSEQLFEIQPTGTGTLSLMAGLMTLSEDGNVTISGNLNVAGNLEADTLLTNLVQPADFGNPFQVQVAGADSETGEVKESRFEIINELGAPVATISAEGRADFAEGIGVGAEELEEPEAEGESIESSKSSGKAIIPANSEDITIKSSRITKNSLVYVTPVGSTRNQVLYVKSQEVDDPDTTENEGEFVVGFDSPAQEAVNFNWWIVN